MVDAPLERKGVLVQVKADWEAFCNMMGFALWNSVFRPCLICNVLKEHLDELSGVTLETSPWDANEKGDYEAACQSCEVVVTLRTSNERRLISVVGGCTSNTDVDAYCRTISQTWTHHFVLETASTPLLNWSILVISSGSRCLSQWSSGGSTCTAQLVWMVCVGETHCSTMI